MEKLLENINSKIIDKDTIFLFWKSCIEKDNLYDECNTLNYGRDDNYYAYYSASDKKIMINLCTMLDRLDDMSKYYELKKDDYYTYINIRIIQFLLHEIEHAKQEKLIKSNDNSMENILLSCSKLNMQLWELMKDGAKMYHDTYIYNPSERMAEIKSYKKILPYLRLLSKKVNIDKAVNAIKREYIIENLYGYIEGMCPTEIYLTKTNFETIWMEMVFYDSNKDIMYDNIKKEYNLEKRLLLGLPINNNEFSKISLLRDKYMI